MQLQLIIAAIIAALSAGGAWKVQDWRYDAKEKERTEIKLAEVRASAARDIRWLDNVFIARDKAAARAIVYRRDADDARAARDGLLLTLDNTLREAESSQAACLERATALSDILKTVTAERRSLSEKADRHVNDLQACREGWPK
jgi:hypothetical protein